MRLAIAATTLLLCFGLMSCGDDGDSKPIAPSSQSACKCKPGEQQAPQLKPQVTDSGSGRAHGWHGKHRRFAGRGHASWAHDRSHHVARGHYAAYEHRYAAREHYRAGHEAWRKHFVRHPKHRWQYVEREGWRYSIHEYAPQPFVYDYVSRSRRSTYDYSEPEEYRSSRGPCCHCHQGCPGDGYEGGYRSRYRPAMSINDPAGLDPWQGYSDDNGFTDW
jgi:hypothetical protein